MGVVILTLLTVCVTLRLAFPQAIHLIISFTTMTVIYLGTSAMFIANHVALLLVIIELVAELASLTL